MESDYYLNFENKFRGDREKILNIFSSYEPLIEIAIEGQSSPILIDVGCGRGEWLQRTQNKFYKSIGIESDTYMAKICRDHGLSVIEGDAIDELSKFENDSISVITIFHVIEHLEFIKLQDLIVECQRILSDDGILIMETPSIDNLIVSTKTFYIDHTHINPINAEAMSFHIEQAGFSNVKYYYINGGPLEDANPLKITRILNGIAQDLCIISTKSQDQFNKIFSDSMQWESHLNIGLTLFEAAIEYDLKLESLIESSQNLKINVQNNSQIELMQEEINLLKNEIALLKSKFKFFLFIYKGLKKIKSLIVNLFYTLKKILTLILYKIFHILFNIEIIKDFFISESFYLIIQYIIKILGNSSNSKVLQIRTKLRKILDNKARFIRYNKKLLFHYQQSTKSKEYLEILTRKNK